MNTLRLYLAYSYLFLFFSCVENEIETFDVAIDIQPHGSATIAPEVYGPLFPGDSIAITITPHEGYQFDQWSGTVSSFESTIALFGTKNHRLTASLVETYYLQLVDYDDYRYGGSSQITNGFYACAWDPESLSHSEEEKIILSYNNPVGNRLSIESPYQIETLRVFDLMGKMVLHKTPQQQKLTLNTFTLAAGAYLLRIETPEGQQTVKLIKK